jgi:acetyl esterase/lipase
VDYFGENNSGKSRKYSRFQEYFGEKQVLLIAGVPKWRINVDIEKQVINQGEFKFPSIIITPTHSIGAAVIVHGYGGCKEEQLGLAWRVAEVGLTTITIDLRGHGEHVLPLDNHVLLDIEAAIAFAHSKSSGKVTVIGHSLGGRLTLLSKPDFMIAISPALNQEFSETTQRVLENLRSYRVQENSPSVIFDILKELPLWQPERPHHTLILHGSRDVPEIIRARQDLNAFGVKVTLIEKALHSDIFLLEATFTCIANQLKEWYS